MKTGEVICIMMYSGQVVVGKLLLKGDIEEVEGQMNVETIVGTPRVYNVEQSKDKQSMRISLIPYVGIPEIVSFKEKDIYISYEVKDKELLTQYIKATTNLMVVPADGFDPKKRMN